MMAANRVDPSIHATVSEVIEFYWKYQEFFKLSIQNPVLFMQQVLDGNGINNTLNNAFDNEFYLMWQARGHGPFMVDKHGNKAKENYTRALFVAINARSEESVLKEDMDELYKFFLDHPRLAKFLHKNQKLLQKRIEEWYQTYQDDILTQNFDFLSSTDLAKVAERAGIYLKQADLEDPEKAGNLQKTIQIAQADSGSISVSMSHVAYASYVNKLIRDTYAKVTLSDEELEELDNTESENSDEEADHAELEQSAALNSKQSDVQTLLFFSQNIQQNTDLARTNQNKRPHHEDDTSQDNHAKCPRDATTQIQKTR